MVGSLKRIKKQLNNLIMKRLSFIIIFAALFLFGAIFLMKDYPIKPYATEYEDSIQVARDAAGIDTQTAHIGHEIDTTLNVSK